MLEEGVEGCVVFASSKGVDVDFSVLVRSFVIDLDGVSFFGQHFGE